jgi:hypothetical protein
MLSFIFIFLLSSSVYAESFPVPVTQITEIYDTYDVYIPYECGPSNDDSFGLDTFIGLALGVGVVNTIGIGAGSGHEVAKVLGGLTGGSLANSSRTNTCYSTSKKRKFVEYENCAFYSGIKMCTRNDYKREFITVHKY